jgi:hypothetical protein
MTGPDGRVFFFGAARARNQYAKAGLAWDRPPADGADRPGDDFNRRASWAEVLEPAGWKLLFERGGIGYWRRPGKDEPSHSATTGFCRAGDVSLLYVFSSAAAPFEMEKTYSPFGAYTLLNHAGDYRAAARALAGKGYGKPRAESNGHHRTNGEPSVPSGPAVWEPPVPIDRMPGPVAFPLAVLPGPIADYVGQCAWATNSPPDFVAVPLLGIAAGCLGAARALAITRDHVQPATLFTMVVGLPGTGKSPALERVVDPVEANERKNFERWRRLLAAWQEEDPEVRGDKPQPRRLLIDDTTTEALMRTLHGNQRGLIMVRDELSALVAGLNQYKEGKGHDRQVYLKIWSASTIRVDRKSNEGGLPLVVRRPSLSVIGGVQPDVVESFFAGDRNERINDGFLDRFLFSYPQDLPAIEEQFREIDDQAAATWGNAVEWLLSLEQWRNPEGDLRPKIVGLTPDGKEAWVQFTKAHAAELNAEAFPDHLRGAWSKLRGYCGRLALVLHYLDMACRPATGSEDVGGDAVAGAARLMVYFKGHYLRVAARMNADPRQDEANRILAWLQRKREVVRFTRREVYSDLRRSFNAPEGLDRPLALLAQYGFVRPLEAEARQGGGRRPSPGFEINPLWDRARFVYSVYSVAPKDQE